VGVNELELPVSRMLKDSLFLAAVFIFAVAVTAIAALYFVV